MMKEQLKSSFSKQLFTPIQFPRSGPDMNSNWSITVTSGHIRVVLAFSYVLALPCYELDYYHD